MKSAVLARKTAAAPVAEAKVSKTGGLRIGEPNDAFEQEADRVADEMMAGGPQLLWSLSRMGSGAPLRRKCACGGSAEGECEECKKKGVVQRRSAGNGGPAIAPPAVEEVLRSPGRPLDSATRSFFEPRFGFDFSNVRIHTDAEAAQSAHSVNAVAYAVSNDVVFSSDSYKPETPAGRRLLAHELAHVVQQADGRLSRSIQRQTCTPGDPGDAPAGLKVPGFKQNSPILPGQDYAVLSALAARLKRNPGGGELQVHGFASEEGDANFNIKLSCARAFGVRQVIQANGVSVSISLFAHGASTSLGATPDNNRAVVIVEPAAPTDEGGKKKSEEKTPETPPAKQEEVPLTSADCAVNPSCPKEFCTPFSTRAEAIADRDAKRPKILGVVNGISPKAGPLFDEYLMGGRATVEDLSASAADDFTKDSATIKAAEHLKEALKAKAPAAGQTKKVDIKQEIPDAIKDLDNPSSPDKLAYVTPPGLPGLIAGGIGKDQASCKVGAQPSNLTDERRAEGTATITSTDSGVTVALDGVTFTVNDTIDFCPGNCGGTAAQALGFTIEMSKYEASGISGDVPFTVRFPAPLLVGAYEDSE